MGAGARGAGVGSSTSSMAMGAWLRSRLIKGTTFLAARQRAICPLERRPLGMARQWMNAYDDSGRGAPDGGLQDPQGVGHRDGGPKGCGVAGGF